MARTVRDAKLEIRAARERLPRGPGAHWRTLIPSKLHLGYRRRKKAHAGFWIVRFYLGIDAVATGKSPYRVMTIGVADDFQDADGTTIFTYAQAQARALEWRPAESGEAAPAAPLTVAHAIERYISNLVNNGRRTDDIRSRANLHILPQLGSTLVEDLTSERLQRWLADIAKQPAHVRGERDDKRPRQKQASDGAETQRRRRSTANRVATVLKAALNYAFDAGLVSSNDAWGRRLKTFRSVDAARIRYLSVAEAQRLINACDQDFRKLVQAALQTGCRYGELCRLQVHDFNADVGTLMIRESKSGKARHVVLTDEGIAFFKQLTVGRAGHGLILKNEGRIGRALEREHDRLMKVGSSADNARAEEQAGEWRPSEQGRPMTEASKRAKITPAVTFHGLRHTWASLAVMNGVPLMVVAKNLGHADTRMVERHYGHLAPSYIADAIRAGAPRFGVAKPTNVVRHEKPR